jgi:Trk K+ transport system NAD-binding subunit
MITHPAVFRMLTEGGDLRIEEATLTSDAFTGRELRECRWPGDVLDHSIQRDGDLLVPDGSTRLLAGDRLSLVGTEGPVLEAVEQIGGGDSVAGA